MTNKGHITRDIEARNRRNAETRESYAIMDSSFNIREGVVKLNVHNTLAHEMAKAKLMYLLKKAGYKAYSEIITIKGDRFDVYVPDVGQVIEILGSEKEIEFKEKKLKYVRNYPCLNFVQAYRADDILKKEWIL